MSRLSQTFESNQEAEEKYASPRPETPQYLSRIFKFIEETEEQNVCTPPKTPQEATPSLDWTQVPTLCSRPILYRASSKDLARPSPADCKSSTTESLDFSRVTLPARQETSPPSGLTQALTLRSQQQKRNSAPLVTLFANATPSVQTERPNLSELERKNLERLKAILRTILETKKQALEKEIQSKKGCFSIWFNDKTKTHEKLENINEALNSFSKINSEARLKQFSANLMRCSSITQSRHWFKSDLSEKLNQFYSEHCDRLPEMPASNATHRPKF